MTDIIKGFCDILIPHLPSSSSEKFQKIGSEWPRTKPDREGYSKFQSLIINEYTY